MRRNGATLLPEATRIGRAIKATQMEVIHFHDPRSQNPDGTRGREIIILYSLGDDGVVREFVNGKWTAFPITE